MTINLKKALLTGVAFIAAGVFSTAAQAADLTLTGNATWGTVANGMVATPTAGDNVILGTNTLTFDGSETGVTTAGAITSASTGALTITNADDAGDVAFTIGSVTITGAGNITQSLTDATTRDIATTITGDVSTGGNLALTNVEPDAAATNDMTIGGTLTVTGTTGLTAGDANGASTTTLSVTGNTAFTGAVTVTGGDNNAAADATLTLSGATNTFTGGLTLTNGALGGASLVLDGTAAQTVTGVIAGDGDVTVTNTASAGVTFAGDSTNTGTWTVNNDGNNQAVTFTGDNAGAIVLGDNTGADTITATFSGTTQTISGGITGGASETVNVNFAGGSAIALTGAASSGIDTAAISGSTTVTTSQDLTATTITVGSGSMLVTTANTVTGAITNNGTLRFGGGDVTGAITGSGALDVDAAGTFTGAVTQGSADIAAVTLTQGAASGWDVDTTTFSGDGTLDLAAGAQTVAGNFTNTTDGDGSILIADSATTTAIEGNLGASTAHSLKALTIAGAAANVTTTTGNLYVDTITQNAADTLSFIGTSAQTVSGTVSGGALSVGASSNVTFDNTVTAVSDTVLGTVRHNANATLSGTHTNTGTTYVGVGATLAAATLTDTGTYVLDANDANGTLAATDFGSLTDTGGGATLTADNIRINVTGQMTAGTVRLLTGINTGAATLADNSFQYSFAAADNGADTDVTVTRASITSLAAGTPNSGVARVLDSLTATGNAQIGGALDNIAAARTNEDFDDVLESLQPDVDGGYVIGSLDVSGRALDMTGMRLAALRTGSETGMSAGNAAQGLHWWAQSFGQTSTQDSRDGVAGYDAKTWGGAVGVDTESVSGDATVGVAFSYGNTDVNSRNANNTDTDVDSYQMALYGDYEIGDAAYINGMAAYAWSSIDTIRHDVGGTPGLMALANFNASQFSARFETGHDYAHGNATLTPKVMLDWAHYLAEDYTETGAGGLNLAVDNEALDVLALGVGLDMGWTFVNINGSKLSPRLSAAYSYDFIGDPLQVTSHFTGGGAAFDSRGADPAQGALDLGASIAYFSVDNWEFLIDYDFTYKQDYDAHSGFVRAAYRF